MKGVGDELNALVATLGCKPALSGGRIGHSSVRLGASAACILGSRRSRYLGCASCGMTVIDEPAVVRSLGGPFRGPMMFVRPLAFAALFAATASGALAGGSSQP